MFRSVFFNVKTLVLNMKLITMYPTVHKDGEYKRTGIQLDYTVDLKEFKKASSSSEQIRERCHLCEGTASARAFNLESRVQTVSAASHCLCA